MTNLTVATTQLEALQTAISAGKYTSLQDILLVQAMTLHGIGMASIGEAEKALNIKHKKTYIDLALRAFGQSQKAMLSVKMMGR